MQKKEWRKPELIVLVRSEPEETILVICKATTVRGGPTYRNNACRGSTTSCTGSCNQRQNS